MSMQNKVDERLAGLESRLTHLEDLLVGISQKLDQVPQSPVPVDEEKALALKDWVTDYVSMRLQQLVPEECEHPPAEDQDGPFLGGTSIRCTEEVIHRVKRIPIPFVREMVVQRVAENARGADLDVVDVEFFEQAATF